MAMSGKIAILNTALNAVVEIRDLGLQPVETKSNVRAFSEIIPAIGVDEYLVGYTDNIGAEFVVRTWTKATYDYSAIDQTALNAALIEPGSVLRALVEVMRDEINILRQHAAIGLAPRTAAQVKAALKAKMR